MTKNVLSLFFIKILWETQKTIKKCKFPSISAATHFFMIMCNFDKRT